MASVRDEARERIAFAADLALPQALALYPQLSEYVGYVKVGLSLFVEHGPQAVEAFRSLGARVFLDLKLHDIPNTVELAARKAGELGASLLTVHASGGEAMLRAAMTGAREGAAGKGLASPKVLAVTALTSLSDADVSELGAGSSAAAWAQRLAALAGKSGVDGFVSSAREVAALKTAQPAAYFCTPGIRPAGGHAGDQARVETPASAIRAGSSLLVIGRPLSNAADPAAVAKQIHAEVAAAL